MTREEAIARAEATRLPNRVPAEAEVGGAELRWIEIPELIAKEPGPVRDSLAWCVKFLFLPSWIEVAVEDSTGEIVRVERSRGAAFEELLMESEALR